MIVRVVSIALELRAAWCCDESLDLVMQWELIGFERGLNEVPSMKVMAFPATNWLIVHQCHHCPVEISSFTPNFWQHMAAGQYSENPKMQ